MKLSHAIAYSNEVKNNQRLYYAVWEPSRPVKLGDYGYMSGNIFVQMGNISIIPELKSPKLVIRKNNLNDDKLFTSGQGVEFSLSPKISTSSGMNSAKASLTVNFTKENAVFFNAAGCTYETISNKAQIGDEILRIHKKNNDIWKREVVLVTDRVIAKRSLILISTTSDFSISLDAKLNISEIDLANANLGLKIKNIKSGGYQTISQKPLTLLIGLCKIQRRFPSFFSNSKFKPYLEFSSKFMLHTLTDIDFPEFEESEEELCFAQFNEDLTT